MERMVSENEAELQPLALRRCRGHMERLAVACLSSMLSFMEVPTNRHLFRRVLDSGPMLAQRRASVSLAEAASLESFAVRRCLALSVAFAWAVLAAAAHAASPSPGGTLEPPSVEFGELYQAVEMAGLFPDQK